jgi:hypothetical protein
MSKIPEEGLIDQSIYREGNENFCLNYKKYEI